MLNRSRARVMRAVVWRQIAGAAFALVVTCTSTALAQAGSDVDSRLDTDTDAGAEAEASNPNTPWNYLRVWYRLHQRWHRLWDGRQTHEQCGDGQVQGNEQCDDGNLEPADGCDASCELEDVTATPGDDRPGFVLCASSADPGLICSPEQRCCRSPENVCDSLEQDCQREDVTVGWGDNCDGPEDCEEGLTCVRGKYGASCTPANPQQGYPVLCHADKDCNFIPESLCGADGLCRKL